MDENQVDDRKSAIEAAFNAAETATSEDAANDVKETVATEITSGVAEASEKTDAPEVATEPPKEEASVVEAVQEKPIATDRAPQSWKQAQKAKWDKLDPDIRQEVLRREHETTRVLNETAQVRQFATQFQEAIQPYMARIQQVGNPVKAIQNLLAADHLLATGPAATKAQYLAKLIQDYGVDIQALDAALAGKPVADPVESRVEQMLQQRLQPFQQYLTAQQQREQYEAQRQQQQIQNAVEQMAQDPEYPHFEAVRETMADLIDLAAKKGSTMDLKTAYNRAVAMDPTISQVTQAAQANAKAQRALQASASVRGAPSGSSGGKPATLDRRAAIEAAFEAAGGR